MIFTAKDRQVLEACHARMIALTDAIQLLRATTAQHTEPRAPAAKPGRKPKAAPELAPELPAHYSIPPAHLGKTQSPLIETL